MPKYTVTHPETGRKLTLTGTAPPTEAELDDIFAQTAGDVPTSKYKHVTGNMNPTAAESERFRRQAVADLGTAGTQARNMLNTALNPNVRIPAADSPSDFALRVLPQSITQLPGKILQGGYEALKGQTDPLVQSLSTLQPAGLPGPKMERNAAQTTRGLAEAMTAPTGLMGLERAKEAWLTDPAGSLLAVAPLAPSVKPSLRALGKTAETATAIPRAAVADVARMGANKLTDMTLKQSTTLKPEVRAQNVKTALEGGFLPNSKGVDNLNTAIARTEQALAEGIKAGDAAQVKGTLDRAVANVERLREKANMSSDPVANNALIDAEIQRLQSHPLLDETGAVNISTLQRMKVEQGRELAKTYGGEKATQFQNTIDKARVRGMKEELEAALDQAFPELSATNKKLGEYYNLKKSLERAANRIENNQGIGIGLPIKGGAGATIGGMAGGPVGAAVGGGIGTLIGIIEHPSVAPRLAQQLYKASKGSLTMPQAKALVKQRLADLSFVDFAAKKGRDQRGLVGIDINGNVTPELKAWAEKSKVKDAEGRPLVVYHGTNKSIDAFDFDRSTGIGMHFGTKEQAQYRHNTQAGSNVMPVYLNIKNPIRLADHVWDDPRTIADGLKKLDSAGRLESIAREWEKAKSVRIDENLTVPEYREAINKYHEAVSQVKKRSVAESRKILEENGYDGVIYKNEVEGAGDSYIAFRPEQIKSAIGNNGRFAKNDKLND